MATKFTELPEDATVEAADEFLIRNAADGTFKKTTADKIKTFIGATVSAAWGSITGTLSNQTDLQNELNAKQNALGFTPENVANKQTDLTASATKYPTVDAVIAGIAAIPSVVDASTTVKGISKLSTAPASATNPIAVGDNDSRNSDARTPLAHSHPQSEVTNLVTDLGLKKTDSMATNKLLGRGTAGTGVIEEITLGTNLSFTGTTLDATGGGLTQQQSLTLITFRI